MERVKVVIAVIAGWRHSIDWRRVDEEATFLTAASLALRNRSLLSFDGVHLPGILL
jgi:hypothetical protein